MNNLRQHGHEVAAASPSSGVNTITGEGLAKALTGAQVVVDVANSPSWEDTAVLDFFEHQAETFLLRKVPLAWGTMLPCQLLAPIACWRVVIPCKNGPGKSDQGLKDSVHDRPRHAVLRVRGRHRPILHRRCNGDEAVPVRGSVTLAQRFGLSESERT